jgi:predicted Zn-ribbon and HTH transcriptional regulator
MTNRQVDQLAKFAADWVKAGGKLDIQVLPDTCRKCGKGVYQHNGSPSWQNRFTCPACKHSVSR